MLAASTLITPPVHDFNPAWEGPRSRVSRAKVKPGKLRAMKGEMDSEEKNLTLIDVMLLFLRERGPATTKQLRDMAFTSGLIFRVPKHRRKPKDACKLADEADGPDGRKRGFFTGIMSRCYNTYWFIDEVGILNRTREVVHQINDKGLAYLTKRMNDYVPDDIIQEVQLKLGLNQRVQHKPPKSADQIDALDRATMEARLRTEFDEAISKAVAGQHAHHVYLEGRERPFIWRTDRNAPIMLSEAHHPFHAIFKHYVVEAAQVRMKISVRSDYDGGEGKPKALLIETRPRPVAVPEIAPAPAPEAPSAPESVLAESVLNMRTKLRGRPDHSAQDTLPLVYIPAPGRLSKDNIVRIILDEQARVTTGVFVSRENAIRARLMDAQNQIDQFCARTIDEMTPVLVLVNLPSYELRDPQNPYHYCAKPFFDYADLNGFVLEIRLVSNGFSALYVPKPKAISAA